MNRSEDIVSLAKALVEFQRDVKPIPFNSVNPFFKSKYADLAGIIKTVKPSLEKCGLTVSQLVDSDEDGNGFIRTLLIHTSGQYIESRTRYSTNGKPQEQGSAITYMRRYSIAGILGVVADPDDDGNAANSIDTIPPLEIKIDKEESKKLAAGFIATIETALEDDTHIDTAIEEIEKARKLCKGDNKKITIYEAKKIGEAVKKLEEKIGEKI